MNNRVNVLYDIRNEQVGAARAIAELAQKNSTELSDSNIKHNRKMTYLMAMIGSSSVVLNFLISHHVI